MEIKTTNEIVEYDNDTAPDRYAMSKKEIPKFRKINEEFKKKKWVVLDDIKKYIVEEIEGFKKYRKGVIRNSQLVKACDCFLNHLKELKEKLK